jgi:arylsulfatase A-like enzyme
MRSPWLWLGAAVLLGVYSLLAPKLAEMQGGGDPRPVGTAEDIAALAERDDLNVLFILIDTLRADRLGAYGYERATSPLLDVLAERGVRFDRHLSQSSWTKCSMASLWTSLYPPRTGVTRFDEVLPEAPQLPAEIFADAGFRTAGIFRNGWLMGYFGFGQGFEIYARPSPEQVTQNVRAENPTITIGGSDLDATATAREFLRLHGHERWFLYMHLMDVHQYLYSEDTALFGTSYSDIYDNSILWTNLVLDPFFDELARSGQLEKTLIVVTSDHGEAFGERGYEGHARHVYKETTEVPFIISFPFRFEEPIVIRERTAGVDVWPTILDLLGLPPMKESDGRSLKPAILAAARGESPPEGDEDRPAFAYLDQNWGRANRTSTPTLAIADGSRRYVRYEDSEGETLQEHLFDASSDPSELEDRVDVDVEGLESMRALASEFESNSASPFESQPKIELDEMQLNQLRALGYAVP